MLVDYAADPINYHYYIRSIRNWDTIYYTLGTGVLPRLNSINQIKGVIKRGKKASIDYYLFAQGAYHQMRLSLITDGASEKDPFDEESDDDWDDDLDDEDDQAANNR
jgi:ABC-type transporter lipoprotein component MlaA